MPIADTADIVVIGAGGCGLMAALVAARAGASVLLLEKTDAPGGGTAFSSRGIRAAGTRLQRELGVVDGAQQYAADILGRNDNESDAALTRRLAEVSGPVADLLTDVVGIGFSLGEFVFGHSARRSHSWKESTPITDFMFAAVQREQNVEVRFSTPVLSIEQDASGAVAGVKTESGTISARSVILASGGFGASQELLAEYIPQAVGIPFPGHYGSTGDGIKMGLALGAGASALGSFQPYPAYVGPEKRSVPPEVALAGAVMVSRQGQRFVDETRYPGGLSAGILDLPGKQACEIFDDRIYQAHRGSLETFAERGSLRSAGTTEELADALGIDAGGLSRTVVECNVTAGNGPDVFGRTLPAPLEAPFYGIWVKVALYHTQGGLMVNVDAQVLRPDHTPIPNLYAGGGVAVGVSGTGMAGYLPGNGQLASLGLGMIAGEHAAESLGASD